MNRRGTGIYRRASGMWHVDAQRNGQRFRVSLKTKNENLARQRFSEMEREWEQLAMRKAAGATLGGLPIGALQALLSRTNEAWIREDLVYIVYNPRAHAVKIGHSSAVLSRLTDLQCASPDGLELLLLVPGGVLKERELHSHFIANHRRGEWFSVSWQFIDFIEKARQNQTQVWAGLRERMGNAPSVLPQAPEEGEAACG